MPSPPLSRAHRLRLEVGRLRAREVRRRFPATIHLGEPAGEQVWFALSTKDTYDAGLRFLVVESLLASWGDDSAELWLCRSGVPELHDQDHGWWADGRAAFAARGVELTGFSVVTRSGWLDPLTGDSRAWKRLRLRANERGESGPGV